MNNINLKDDFDKDNNNNKMIFSYVSSKKWDNLLNFIKNNKDFDYNIYDTSNISLIEHIITSDNNKIIKELLLRNIKIDVTGDNNHSILYDVIKYSKNDILTSLINANDTYTGFNILDIRDNDGCIPIYYCVKFNNFDAFSKIIKKKFNYYNKNNKGENFLFYSILNNNNKMFNVFFDVYPEITDVNINGETIFHYIVKHKAYDFFKIVYDKYKNTEIFVNAINICEYVYNFSILHYVAINDDKYFFEIFDKLKLFTVLNGNIQDVSGNIFYHYFIKNIIEKNIDEK